MSPIAIEWIAFVGPNCIAKGSPTQVAEKLHATLKASPNALPLVFDARSSERIELVWQSPLPDLLSQLPAVEDEPQPAAPRGRGRPKLGVVPREVTLLPRHWEWLSKQSGGASVALRKLVQTAMKASASADLAKSRIHAAYAFMTVMAADQPRFEDASRALFADDIDLVDQLSQEWPADVRSHLLELLKQGGNADDPV